MSKEHECYERCSQYVSPEILDDYYRLLQIIDEQPNRYYHTSKHCIEMLNTAIDLNWLTDELYLAIMWHDMCYDVRRNDNEEMSVDAMLQYYKFRDNSQLKIDFPKISNAILSTKYHNAGHHFSLSERLNHLDLETLSSFDIQTIVESEFQIFKEYQFVDFKEYKEKRLKLLKKLGAHPLRINYLEHCFKPNIAVFAGSFNPFHLGHLNILEKAEKIFDKVIVAIGHNPEKEVLGCYFPKTLHYRQQETYDGLLTDFIESLNYPVTLIRGLRDANDLLYESNQACFLKELKTDIKIINVLCDREFSHISSSSIRNLRKYTDKLTYEVE